MGLLDKIAAGIFCLFLATPVMSLAIWGYSAWAENPPELSSMDFRRFASIDNEYRKSTMKEVVTFTPAGMAAQSAKSNIDYRLFGYFDTQSVISGEDGWLFYKGDFKNACTAPDTALRVLHHIEAMRTVAAGAGINLLVSVSPDKSVFYQDKLGARASAAAGCKLQFARRWRRDAKAINSSVVDHYDAMSAYQGGQLLYFKTDTHWNDYGEALSLRQLAAELEIDIPLPPDIAVTGSRQTDLFQLLRLRMAEAHSSLDVYWETSFKDAASPGIVGALIIHDSFYGMSKSLRWLFPHMRKVNIDRFTRRDLGQLPDTIVINSVERAFINRFRSGRMSWGGALGGALLSVNQQRAERCEFTPQAFTTRDLSASGTAWSPSSSDPKIFVTLPEHEQPCIRFSFRSGSNSQTQVFLPSSDGKYSAGLSVDIPDRETERSSALVLPGYGSRTIRIDPISGMEEIQGLSIEVGTVRDRL